MEFDEVIADEVLSAIKAGASMSVAAAYANVDVNVPRNWLMTNVEFAEKIRKARADVSLLAIGIMRRDMNDNPKQAQYLAESIQADLELERLRELTT